MYVGKFIIWNFYWEGWEGIEGILLFLIMLGFKNYTSIVEKCWSQNENGSKIINYLDSKKTRDFALEINLSMFHLH
jgi:hypothetical protein